MRIYLKDLTRPKRAATCLRRALHDVPLNQAQRAIAISLGYESWHDLEKCHNTQPENLLHDALSGTEFQKCHFRVIQSIAETLQADGGDVQHALASARLIGGRQLTFSDHETIRSLFWRSGPMPWLGNGQTGSVIYTLGEKPNVRAYQKSGSGGGLILYITDEHTLGLRTRSEVRVPRSRIEDFVPRRLWMPYGWWTLRDGSEVLFSRDYKPLWKIRSGEKAERMMPWLWIENIQKQNWFTEDGLWQKPEVIFAAEQRLSNEGISTLPALADALPIIIKNENFSVDCAVEEMKKVRENAGAPTPLPPQLMLKEAGRR
ncbi:MAG: hypothetical protein RIF37_14045 [Rhodospirillaceae bacterium]